MFRSENCNESRVTVHNIETWAARCYLAVAIGGQLPPSSVQYLRQLLRTVTMALSATARRRGQLTAVISAGAPAPLPRKHAYRARCLAGAPRRAFMLEAATAGKC